MESKVISYKWYKKSEFPKRLLNLPGMPDGLYVYGSFPDDHLPCVAIVGGRGCSQYGKAMAYKYAKVFAASGVQVISGMALGVDGAAHRGALSVSGAKTYAVFGCGVDVCYPRHNRDIYEQLPKRGGIISEFEPGSKPLSWHFPIRNRLISAFADIVLVIDAKLKSGSLITAKYALDQGKVVFALPGNVDNPLSEGGNRLIYDGAGIAYSPEIILEELGVKRREAKDKKCKIKLAPKEDMVYSCLSLEPKNLSTILVQTALAPDEIAVILTDLQIMGLVLEISKNHYIKWS